MKNLKLIEVSSPEEFYFEPVGLVRPEVPQNPDQALGVKVG